MKILYLLAIIFMYQVNALNPEVLMTESMQFKPKTNSVKFQIIKKNVIFFEPRANGIQCFLLSPLTVL